MNGEVSLDCQLIYLPLYERSQQKIWMRATGSIYGRDS